MTLFVYLIVLWIWRRLLRPPTAQPKPLHDDFLTEARKTHPKEMEQVDFASWELQMETEEPWK